MDNELHALDGIGKNRILIVDDDESLRLDFTIHNYESYGMPFVDIEPKYRRKGQRKYHRSF